MTGKTGTPPGSMSKVSASVRGQKRLARERRRREVKTCYVCGRTGTRGFIRRQGQQVCWAVPRCMERVFNRCNDFKRHRCKTPATGMPLDGWTCPVCDKHWWATLVWPDDESLEWLEQLS